MRIYTQTTESKCGFKQLVQVPVQKFGTEEAALLFCKELCQGYREGVLTKDDMTTERDARVKRLANQ